MWGFELTVMMVMIAINSVFAAYEIALASISLGRLESLVTRGLTGAASAVRMKTRMEASLAVVQLGITLVGVIAAATGGAGAEESIEPYLSSLGIANFYSGFMAIVLVVIPLTIVTIVFGELIPKVFALRNNERVCLALSPAMEWFSRSVWPAVWMLETSVSLIMRFFSRQGDSLNPDQEKAEEAALQELRAVAAIARTSRLIGIREEAIINNAARLTRTLVRNVMLPVRYVSMLNVNDSLEQCLIAAHLNMHTRFPVAEKVNDPQAIIGYVNFKDLVAILRTSPSCPSLRGILRPLRRISDEMVASECLELLIHERIHIALVQDRSGTTTGMLTLEDILEELVGEIHDEYDRLPSTISKAGMGWIVGGHANLSAIQAETGLLFPVDTAEQPPATLNDWVAKKLNRPVESGETIIADDLRIVVRKVRRQWVQEAHISQNMIR